MTIPATGEPSTAVERTLDDETLWSALLQGEVRALEALYDRYSGIALGLATRMLRDRQRAEEVVQESFLQVWRAAAGFDPRRGAFRGWLLAIVHHRAVDVLRGQAARPKTLSWDPLAFDRPDSTDLWTTVSQSLTGETVQQALHSLSIEQREAIELAFFGGYTHVEIAERLGLPLGTVKGRLRLGLRRLRTLLLELEGSVDGSIIFAENHLQ